MQPLLDTLEEVNQEREEKPLKQTKPLTMNVAEMATHLNSTDQKVRLAINKGDVDNNVTYREEKPKYLTKKDMAILISKSKGSVSNRIYANNFEDFNKFGYDWNPNLTSKDVGDGIRETGRFVLIEII